MRRRSPRVAAWVALIAAAAVVVALGVLLFRDAPAMLLALAALVVAGGAGWIALTRRGLLRALAVGCGGCALAGGAVALVAFDAIDELIVLGAAIAVFGAATRTALVAPASSPPSASPSLPTGTRSADRAAKGALLMNPRSGGGKVETFDLPREARRRGVTAVLLEPGDDLRELAGEVARSAEVIGMAGGDGSQALVAQVAMEHNLPYVCVPAGTRNHFALDLGLDRRDVVGALDGFTDGVERRIDLAFANDRVFVNNVSLGVYAEVVQSEAYREAKLQTAAKMLPELLGPDAAPFDLRFAQPETVGHLSAQLVLVSNNPYVLDRAPGRGSRPRLDSGRLGIIAAEIPDAWRAMKLIALEAVGRLRRYERWLEWSAPEFEVASGSPISAGIDGEAVVMDSPLRFKTVPAGLRVRLPRAAPGLSPAALTPGLTRAALGDLWGIAAGRR